jgi:UDP-glucose 4-epimerase
LLAAFKLPETGHAGGSFNFGTGTGFSVREILTVIQAEERGARWLTPSSRAAPANPTYLVADPSAAQKRGNFVPRHSDLPTVIPIAWA